MEYEFISCDRQLPPTECPLMLELPAGSVIYDMHPDDAGELQERATKMPTRLHVRAHRINHIETKERDMRFELLDGLWFIGRPGWSYP